MKRSPIVTGPTYRWRTWRGVTVSNTYCRHSRPDTHAWSWEGKTALYSHGRVPPLEIIETIGTVGGRSTRLVTTGFEARDLYFFSEALRGDCDSCADDVRSIFDKVYGSVGKRMTQMSIRGWDEMREHWIRKGMV